MIARTSAIILRSIPITSDLRRDMMQGLPTHSAPPPPPIVRSTSPILLINPLSLRYGQRRIR